MPRVAVVGHVEWVRFVRVPRPPLAGEVVHGEALLEEPAGGGAVAAVQLARLAGRATLVTALGEDELAERSIARLSELGVEVWAARRKGRTRSAVTLIDDAGERAIVTVGERLHARVTDANIDWSALAEMDAIYFTAGEEPELRAARDARVLVASPRAGDGLGRGVQLDALVFSDDDPLERDVAQRARGDAELLVRTAGEQGGFYSRRSGGRGRWGGTPPPGEPRDSYGCGDSFAAGFTYGLGAGMTLADSLALGARCGASCLTGSGPYERQLKLV